MSQLVDHPEHSLLTLLSSLDILTSFLLRHDLPHALQSLLYSMMLLSAEAYIGGCFLRSHDRWKKSIVITLARGVLIPHAGTGSSQVSYSSPGILSRHTDSLPKFPSLNCPTRLRTVCRRQNLLIPHRTMKWITFTSAAAAAAFLSSRVAAYIPARPVNDTSAMNFSDSSTLELMWYPHFVYRRAPV